MVKEYHPDVNKEKNASEKFKQINEAYKYLLKNPSCAEEKTKNNKQKKYYQEFEEFSDEEEYDDY